MQSIHQFLQKRRYDFLLFALLMHLYNAVFFVEFDVYTVWVWPLNMLMLGISSYGIFAERSIYLRWIKNLLFAAVMFSTLLAILVRHPTEATMTVLNIVYIIFYILIFVEVLRFLTRPGYINTDLIVAAICGYLLLIEVGVFSMQYLYYIIPHSFRGISTANNTLVFTDMVYFCTITITSIGFGDITPTHHLSKSLTGLLAIFGQFYQVVLVGIIISKYTSGSQKENNEN